MAANLLAQFVRYLIGAFALLHLAAPAMGQGATSVEKVSLDIISPFERGNKITGELRIPNSSNEPVSAVLIINSTTGPDGRGAFYAEALNRAGIATFEIDMFQSGGRGASSPVQNLPHAFQSLRYLAAHPRIDPARIGALGLSWGGQVALLTSSATLSHELGDHGLRFAAILALYPQCWVIRTARNGRDPLLKRPIFDQVTGRPVHILAGDRDAYDGPDGCQLFLHWLPAHARPHYDLTVYEGATFAWDSRFSYAPYDAGARRGQGGIVHIVADPERARISQEFTVRYFLRYLNRS